MGCWHLPYCRDNVDNLAGFFKEKAILDCRLLTNSSEEPECSGITPDNLALLSEEEDKKIEEFRKWMQTRRYSESTIKT